MDTSPPREGLPQDSDLQELADTRAALTFRLSALVLALFLPLPILGGFTSLLDASCSAVSPWRGSTQSRNSPSPSSWPGTTWRVPPNSTPEPHRGRKDNAP